jgi:hypothetical protein
MSKNDPVVFDQPDPLSKKHAKKDDRGDLNAPYYCKVCDTWKRRTKFSRTYAPEHVCRNCAPQYAKDQRKVAAALWEMYDSENKE